MNRTTLHSFSLLLLRVSFSGMLLMHGIPKLMKLLSADLGFADPIGIGAPASLLLAIIGEVVFPILVIIGFKTRWTAIPVIITMGVAAFLHHANDPFAAKELALLYMIGFITIALLGPGRFSLDKK